MFHIILMIAMMMLSLSSMPSHASDGEFLNDKYRGWFFREPEPTPPPPKPKKEKKEDIVISAPPPPEKAFTASWFEKNLPKLRDKAIDEPTKENLLAFLTAQKLFLDAASNFSTQYTNVLMENPWLSGDNFRPSANFGSQYFDKRSKEAKDNLIKKIAEDTGLWYFFASSCESCHVMAPVVRDLQDRVGMKVLAVSIDGQGIPEFPRFVKDRGQAQKYNVTSTPTIMAFRDNKLYLISEGLLSSDQIVDRILYFAKEYKWITEQEYNKSMMVNYNTVIPTPYMQSITPKEVENPALLAERIRKQMIKQNNF